jgi:hypothetical protein
MRGIDQTVDYLSTHWLIAGLCIIWYAFFLAGIMETRDNWRYRRIMRQFAKLPECANAYELVSSSANRTESTETGCRAIAGEAEGYEYSHLSLLLLFCPARVPARSARTSRAAGWTATASVRPLISLCFHDCVVNSTLRNQPQAASDDPERSYG